MNIFLKLDPYEAKLLRKLLSSLTESGVSTKKKKLTEQDVLRGALRHYCEAAGIKV